MISNKRKNEKMTYSSLFVSSYYSFDLCIYDETGYNLLPNFVAKEAFDRLRTTFHTQKEFYEIKKS